VRLYGHAGADVQQSYLTKDVFEGWEADDPLLHSARLLIHAGVTTAENIAAIYTKSEADCARVAAEAIQRPRLKDAAGVMDSIVPPARAMGLSNGPTDDARNVALGSDLKQMDQPQVMSRLINWALTDVMLAHGEVALMGEDVGAKGGVYGVTQKLSARFGPDRVIDTLLDEQSILGLAIGMAHNGFIPMPEIQFLAYLHNAEDQIRGEAATLPFFSNGQFTNPMVVRIAGLGYQKGFGGHFHNDNSLAVLRDIPGVIVAVPSQGDDAVRMLRECVRLAREEQRVVVFVEPIALYPMRDLHAKDDKGWMQMYPPVGECIGLGEVGVTGDGPVAIVTYGNGHYLSQQAAKALAEKGVETRVIDLRWISPLPDVALLAALEDVERVLVVDECRKSGNVGEGVVTLLTERTNLPVSLLAAKESFIATGPAYAATMPSCDSIVSAVEELILGVKISSCDP
jgi:2-oxoisovalerate dehydrogenase E1 component